MNIRRLDDIRLDMGGDHRQNDASATPGQQEGYLINDYWPQEECNISDDDHQQTDYQCYEPWPHDHWQDVGWALLLMKAIP